MTEPQFDDQQNLAINVLKDKDYAKLMVVKQNKLIIAKNNITNLAIQSLTGDNLLYIGKQRTDAFKVLFNVLGE
jgi:predicted nuclease of predicted toxin-antitoxin system